MIARLTKSRIQTYARSIALDGGVGSKWKENMSGADSGAKIRFVGVSFLGEFGQEQFNPRDLQFNYTTTSYFFFFYEFDLFFPVSQTNFRERPLSPIRRGGGALGLDALLP
jgi:hypothetical protein